MHLIQVETYKNQINNLNQQISLFEQKLEQIENDRKLTERRNEAVAKARLQEMTAKMQAIELEKDQFIIRLQNDIQHLTTIIGSYEVKLEDQKLEMSHAQTQQFSIKEELRSEVNSFKDLMLQRDKQYEKLQNQYKDSQILI